MRRKIYNPSDDFNYSYDGRTLTITSPKDKTAVELHIPPEIDGHPVNAIGNGAFQFCHELRILSVPDTVTAVENTAFKGCENLLEAELSAQLNSIGSLAFQDCTSLRSVTISNHTNRVEMNSFKGCRALHTVNVKLRETPDYRTVPFAVSSESEAAVWLYMRAITHATGQNKIKMDKYDATFLEMRDDDSRYRLAVFRLENPYVLNSRTKKIYRDYLVGTIETIIRTDRVDRLTKLGELGCIEEDMLDEYIDIAGRIGGGCTAYLLEHKNRNKKIEAYDFSL